MKSTRSGLGDRDCSSFENVGSRYSGQGLDETLAV